MTGKNPRSWQTWRREERQRLLDARSALPLATRHTLALGVQNNLDRVLDEHPCSVLGIYWPIKHEVNLLLWAAAFSKRRNIALALPVVAEAKAPLEYWHWRPDDRMTRGVWNIPVPTQKAIVKPDVVIAPLVGFNACWRLGYGGGYFDRTLAARQPRPAAIGIGFEIMEVPGFRPQPHDIPMQTVVTESRIIKCHRDLACADAR